MARTLLDLPADSPPPHVCPSPVSRPDPPAPPAAAAPAGSPAGGAAARCSQPQTAGVGTAADQPLSGPAPGGLARSWRSGRRPAERLGHRPGPAPGATSASRSKPCGTGGRPGTLVRPDLAHRSRHHRLGGGRATAAGSGEGGLAPGGSGAWSGRTTTDRLGSVPGAETAAALLLFRSRRAPCGSLSDVVTPGAGGGRCRSGEAGCRRLEQC